MNNWVIPAVFSVFALAGLELFQKISMTQKVQLSALTNNFFIWTLQGIVGLVLTIVFGQLNWHPQPSQFLYLAIISVIYLAGGSLFYTSYKSNSPSVSIILSSVSVIITTLLGILFYKEGVSLVKFFGIGLILFSIIILNAKKNLRFDKYNMYALLGGVCYGFAYTIDKFLALQIPPLLYVSLLCFSVGLASLIFGHGLIVHEASKLKLINYVPMAIVATFGTLFNLFTFMSYRRLGQVGVIDALNNSAVFIVILLEIIILKDRSNLFKKITCATIAFVGVVILSRLK